MLLFQTVASILADLREQKDDHLEPPPLNDIIPRTEETERMRNSQFLIGKELLFIAIETWLAIYPMPTTTLVKMIISQNARPMN
jgi:hypothetical protein